METSKEEQVDVSIVVRASRLRAFIQRDIFADDNVFRERAFVKYYLKRWGIFGGCADNPRNGKYSTENLPWKDWDDVW